MFVPTASEDLDEIDDPDLCSTCGVNVAADACVCIVCGAGIDDYTPWDAGEPVFDSALFGHRCFCCWIERGDTSPQHPEKPVTRGHYVQLELPGISRKRS